MLRGPKSREEGKSVGANATSAPIETIGGPGIPDSCTTTHFKFNHLDASTCSFIYTEQY